MSFKRAALSVLAAAAFAASSPALGEEADPVVATVDGDEIHLSDVEVARGLLPAQAQGRPLADVYDILLDSLINSRLAATKARELGLDETADYKRRMARIGEQILERRLLTDHIEQRITEDALQARYDEMVAEVEGSHQVHGRHILVKSQDVAETLIAKLGDGEDFQALAKEHSIGPSASRGGDLGWFGSGEMVPAFNDAAMALEPGSYTTEPVQTRFGWHVIKIEDRRPVPVPSFDEARTALVNELSAELGRKMMTDLRQDAKIEKTPLADIEAIGGEDTTED